MKRETSGARPMALKQGDLGLLESDVARRLLASRIPARFAYIAGDGTPRVLADVVSLDGRGAADLPGGAARSSGSWAPSSATGEPRCRRHDRY